MGCRRTSAVALMGALIFLLLALPASSLAAGAASQGEFFEKEIRPVLAGMCQECHGPDKAKAGLRLDSRPFLMAGSTHGPVVVEGNPDASKLIHAISWADAELQMPPKRQLTEQQVAAFRAWIEAGAYWPGSEHQAAVVRKDPAKLWIYEPLAEVEPPAISDHEWSQPIDRFVKAKLEEKGLQPVAQADRMTLLRRAYFDLTGLPPTAEEVQAFAADTAPDAFTRLVDDLLSRQQYGERWGRHWLDLVRYADTSGCNSDFPIREAYLYRNYVIDAFNADMPYDQFLREQIAGDLINEAEGAVNPLKGEPRDVDCAPTEGLAEVKDGVGELTPAQHRRIIATGYLAQARRFGSVVATEYPMHLTIDDTIDNLGKVVLGLTVSCARCHDHKFDAISQADYYSLYGIFNSTRYAWPGLELGPGTRDFIPLMARPQYRERTAEFRAGMEPISKNVRKAYEAFAEAEAVYRQNPDDKKIEDRAWDLKRALWKQIKEETNYAKKERPDYPRAYGVVDQDSPRDAPILIKGEPDSPGKVVPRRFIEILGGQEIPTEEAGQSSGRLHLAHWLTDAEGRGGQLAARVMVNRIWQYHFGKGIVSSPNDFGVRGQDPTHPELLDYLAERFIASGWSIKALHREILLSRTWQFSSGDGDPDNLLKDASNDYLWRHHRQRVEAESIRDSLLAVSGKLDPSMDQNPFPFPKEEKWGFSQHHPFNADYQSNRRSVYLMMKRMKNDPFFAIFDGADRNATTPIRNESVTTPQTLFVMNNELVYQAAEGFAGKILAAGETDSNRVDYAFLTAFGRSPSEQEKADSLDYLKSGNSSRKTWNSFARALLRANEFIYVD